MVLYADFFLRLNDVHSNIYIVYWLRLVLSVTTIVTFCQRLVINKNRLFTVCCTVFSFVHTIIIVKTKFFFLRCSFPVEYMPPVLMVKIKTDFYIVVFA